MKKSVIPAEKPKLAQRHLSKMEVRRARVVKVKRAKFLTEVKNTEPNQAATEQAVRLVERVRAAKAAPFLRQYRTSVG